MSAKLAVDIGGTFTDLAIEDGDRRWTAKVLTTPAAPELGVLEGVRVVLANAGLAAVGHHPGHPWHDACDQCRHRAQGRARPR